MIAVEAVTKQNPAIEKAKVTELLTRVHTEPVTKLLKEINDLFSMDECSAIVLYQNKKLNKILQELAKSLSSSISKANKTIAKAIGGQ
jgi:Ni,Fe-hydrogenase maturation factor